MPRLSFLSTIALVMLLGFAAPAHAYLDPAMGSYVLQVLAGVFLGALYVVKVYWMRIRAFLGTFRRSSRPAEPRG